MTVREELDDLRGIVKTLAATVVAHDNQIGEITGVVGELGHHIEGLIKVAEKHAESIANLEKQWQAYINTLPRN